MRIYPRLMLLLVITLVLMAFATNLPATQEQLLKAVPELIGTRYCYGDAEVFSVW
jgi:hypothetical protein